MSTAIKRTQKAETSPITTIADRVFLQLRNSIVEGVLPPESKISEPGLAREFGISRGPLREALSRLEACGLIIRRPNVGASVVSLSIEQFLEISTIRESLEGLAARLAAEAMTDEEIDELNQLLAQHKKDIEQEEGRAYFQKEGNVDFHFRIVQGSKNQRLISLLCNDLYHQLRIYRYQFGMQSPRSSTAFREHENIVAAISARDGELSELLMRHHIRRSRENIQHLLASKSTELKGG